jgi:hypothetical protein
MIENVDGVLRITDGAGEVVYNSATDQLLHFIPPRIDGSVSRPGLSWSRGSSWSERTADFGLATLPSVATHIVGLVRVTYSSGKSFLPGGAWYPAGGSLLLERKTFQTISGTWGDYVSSIGIASIYKSGNQLRFKEEISLRDDRLGALGFLVAPYTLTYRIYPAVFS